MTPLVLTCYLTERQPPLELIVSARAILTGADGRVFVFDENGPHVLPGGRRERAEPVLDALAREIEEEVGCSIVGTPRPLGFLELWNEGPKPEGYPYPYPRNFHVVFSASAGPSYARQSIRTFATAGSCLAATPSQWTFRGRSGCFSRRPSPGRGD